jgi:hypothetical protein
MSTDLHLHDDDNDFRKGAIEEDNPYDKAQTSMRGQLPHRDQDPMLKDADTDFPEPGENPEHSGEETEAVRDLEGVNQDPGHRQKQNQNDRKKDDLAA